MWEWLFSAILFCKIRHILLSCKQMFPWVFGSSYSEILSTGVREGILCSPGFLLVGVLVSTSARIAAQQPSSFCKGGIWSGIISLVVRGPAPQCKASSKSYRLCPGTVLSTWDHLFLRQSDIQAFLPSRHSNRTLSGIAAACVKG